MDPRRASDDAVGRMSEERPSPDVDLRRGRDADVEGGSDTSDEIDGDGWMGCSETPSSVVVADACMMPASVVFQSSSPAVFDVLLAVAEVCFLVAGGVLLAIFFSCTA